MTTTLEEELAALPAAVSERLAAHHFDRALFLKLASRLGSPTELDNRVRGEVTLPSGGDVLNLPPRDSAEGKRLTALGLSQLSEGRAALVVLAGGMATRMGGVVKALVPALPGLTFLDLRLAERETLSRLVGREVPLWLMTSTSTDAAIRDALGPRLDGETLATFSQRLSLRLTPDGHLFRDESGSPSDHAPGHGDLADSLRDSGLLRKFVEKGGRTVTMANLDNLGATLDPLLIGLHADRGHQVTCEVVDKDPGDRGGIPVRHGGRTVVLEELRLPESFDAEQVRVFSTNTFHFDARALDAHTGPWTYFVVTKKVEGQPVIQFERLIGEVTSYMDSGYVRVPRRGEESRFLPVKDHDELARRTGEIERVARARGMTT